MGVMTTSEQDQVDVSDTSALLRALDRVIEENPDPQAEIFDRLSTYDRKQKKNWRFV